jgi:hypothetical protein
MPVLRSVACRVRIPVCRSAFTGDEYPVNYLMHGARLRRMMTMGWSCAALRATTHEIERKDITMDKHPAEHCRGCGAALDEETAVRVERARCSFCFSCYLRHDVWGRPYGSGKSTTPIYHVPRAVAPKPLRGRRRSSPPRTKGEQQSPPAGVSHRHKEGGAGACPVEVVDEHVAWFQLREAG